MTLYVTLHALHYPFTLLLLFFMALSTTLYYMVSCSWCVSSHSNDSRRARPCLVGCYTPSFSIMLGILSNKNKMDSKIALHEAQC